MGSVDASIRNPLSRIECGELGAPELQWRYIWSEPRGWHLFTRTTKTGVVVSSVACQFHCVLPTGN